MITSDGGDWRMRGLCGPATAENFFMRGGVVSKANRAALRLCEGCPVRQECYNHAVANPEKYTRIAGGRVWPGARSRHGRRAAA